MRLGVDYYPEHWPEKRWKEDIGLMKEAGITVARLAEFAWSRLEPEEGKYNFEWIDRVLDLLKEAGIYAIMGTPTAAPPAWLIAKYPEILTVDRRKYRLEFGTRMHRCLSNPDMRRYSRIITEKMAIVTGSIPRSLRGRSIMNWKETFAIVRFAPISFAYG